MQAFPSIFGYQDILARQYIEAYSLDPNSAPGTSAASTSKPTGSSYARSSSATTTPKT